MPSETIERVLEKLPSAKRHGQSWMACCPAHEDHHPSLSVAQGDDGRALLNCHAGCAVEAVVSALDLTMADLMPTTHSLTTGGQRHPNIAIQATQTKVFSNASDAIAALEYQLGRPSAQWAYHDAQGEPIGMVVRWDIPGKGKTIRPLSRVSQGWTIGGMPAPRPIYRLPDLLARPGERVFVCEGEKASEAAREIGLLTTTSAHGSKSASKSDWSVLAGRDVIILPDADEAGKNYADEVANILVKLTPAPIVKIAPLPDLPLGEGGDMADFVELRGGSNHADAIKSEVESLADHAVSLSSTNCIHATPCQGQPIRPQIEPFMPFPTEALPNQLESFVLNAAATIGCDSSFIALPLLVGLASAIGNSRRIQLKYGWTEPAILWGAIIGESGSTKSPALELALRSVRQRQEITMQDYQKSLDQWRQDQEIFEVQKTAWKRNAAKNMEASGDPPEAIHPPTCDRCWTDDATIEALSKLLQENPRGMLVIRDELAGWLNFDRYSSSGKGNEAAKWLEMFGGRSLIIDRKTSDTICVPNATVSIVGGIQPGILARCIGQEHRDNGLLARLLLTMPKRCPKHWTESEINPTMELEIANIFQQLYLLKPEISPTGNPCPALILLSPKGKREWITFYNEHNDEQTNLSGDLAAAWSKLEGYAARFALVHHLTRIAMGENIDNGIDVASIKAGVKLSRWFSYEARRVYAMMGENEEAKERRLMVERINRKGGRVSVRDWQRAKSLPTASAAEAELSELVVLGLGQWKQVVSKKKAGRPSKQFVLAEQAHQNFSLPVQSVEQAEAIETSSASQPDEQWGEL